MIIENKSKSVKVLKACGQSTLRLFPGFNDIGKVDLDGYRSKVSEALFNDPKDKCLFVAKHELSTEERAASKSAKEKNDMLNKAQRINKQNTKKLEKNAKVKKADDKLIKEQNDTIKKQEKLIADLTKRMDAIEDLADDEPEGKKDKK